MEEFFYLVPYEVTVGLSTLHLWDTGSMTSLVNLDWLKYEFNDIQID